MLTNTSGGIQLNSSANILKVAERFLNDLCIEHKKPGKIYQLSKTEVEVIFKHPLYDDPDYIVCPDEYRVIVHLDSGIARWGFQM